MIKQFLQRILRAPVTRLANRISSAPVKKDVFESLDIVLKGVRENDKAFGKVVPYDLQTGRFIIFSDQHKGARDSADDFMVAEKNYLAALDYYYNNDFTFINLGDCEELWENTPDAVMKMNKTVLQAEARFLEKQRYYRIFGNHDLEWKYPFQQMLYLKPLFGDTLAVYEGIELQTQHNNKTYSIFLTHGHQGDQRSDGNPVSMWIVAAIWTPIQRFLDINVNTTSDSFELIDAHNIIMYEWSATQQQLVFISGHTHKPVFASFDHIDLLTHQLQDAQKNADAAAIAKIEAELVVHTKQYQGKKFVKSMAYPSYFNSGCCCFDDGDISGIEIEGGYIRLIKWETPPNGTPVKKVLEASPLQYIFDQLPE
jgi:predicted phosphodiesterase